MKNGMSAFPIWALALPAMVIARLATKKRVFVFIVCVYNYGSMPIRMRHNRSAGFPRSPSRRNRVASAPRSRRPCGVVAVALRRYRVAVESSASLAPRRGIAAKADGLGVGRVDAEHHLAAAQVADGDKGVVGCRWALPLGCAGEGTEKCQAENISVRLVLYTAQS